MVIVIGADDDLGGCVVILKACIFRSGFLGAGDLSSEAGTSSAAFILSFIPSLVFRLAWSLFIFW